MLYKCPFGSKTFHKRTFFKNVLTEHPQNLLGTFLERSENVQLLAGFTPVRNACYAFRVAKTAKMWKRGIKFTAPDGQVHGKGMKFWSNTTIPNVVTLLE